MSSKSKNRRAADDAPQYTNREARRQSAQNGKTTSGEFGKQRMIKKVGSIVLISGLGLALVGSMLPSLPIY